MHASKTHLSVDEQIHHLQKEHHIVFNKCSIDDAKDYLYQFGYTNLIRPYKTIVDDQGDFDEYINIYNQERQLCFQLFKRLQSFELTFKSLFVMNVMDTYQLKTEQDVYRFLDILEQQLQNVYNYKFYLKVLLSIKRKVTHCYDIYILIDRLTLTELFSMYICLDYQLQYSIYTELSNRCEFLNSYTLDIFLERFKYIVKIRNCVMHANSLQVLIDYKNANKGIKRGLSEKIVYVQLISDLIKHVEN